MFTEQKLRTGKQQATEGWFTSSHLTQNSQKKRKQFYLITLVLYLRNLTQLYQQYSSDMLLVNVINKQLADYIYKVKLAYNGITNYGFLFSFPGRFIVIEVI